MDDHNSHCIRPVDNLRNTKSCDVLRDEGRIALDACVKVKIKGKLETRRYDRLKALDRLRGCFRAKQAKGCDSWLDFCEFALPADRDGDPIDYAKTYTIHDIHDALVKLDDIPFVEKYPKKESGSEETRVSIDERRDAVERELEEARANLNGGRRYSFTVAQRRVRDCYANNLAGNDATIKALPFTRSFNIKDIYKAVHFHDDQSIETSCVPNGHVYEKIRATRASIEREYENAATLSETPHRYSGDEADQLLRSCYFDTDVPFQRFAGEVDILQLRGMLHYYDKRIQPHKYPAKGPGSETLRKSIDEHRAKLKEEYETYLASCGNGQKPHEYSRNEAEHRVRDCFAGTFPEDDDMFPLKEDDSGMPRFYQTFDIFDIKQSIEYFDDKKLLEKYPEEGAHSEELKKNVDEHRNSIKEEWEEAASINEIQHGSGFIIQDHFVLTNKHVIDTYIDDEDRLEICISNAKIQGLPCEGLPCEGLPCEVLHFDPGKDVALLYCKNLDLQHSCIFPLQLSVQPLLPGMQIFSFGYPISHTDKTALFVTGNVSGSRETLSGHSLTVLNCSLNHGNSGGPVLAWVDDHVTVVGIATQKHIKDILTPNESLTIEKIKKSLQTRTISDVPGHFFEGRYTWTEIPEPCQVSIHLLTLKLYDALETHSSFNLSNALPGKLVVEFIKDAITKCDTEQKKELNKVLETLR
ncbi:uncharacterized protein LOC111323468 isoform X2 [Stylophora pistillata]|uniref:uncharacterized protein LOC111323468 isoform X2 n=1 Tax=Stylophora pistillata TaxID=50429 RepID=UPI000C055BE9|nr:uncharacterized protein LOC111323468 isoform X2 [Stylophora pistillata]